MTFLEKLKKYLFGLDIIHWEGETLECWRYNKSSEYVYHSIFLTDTALRHLVHKQGLKQRDEYIMKIRFINFFRFKDYLTFRRITQCGKEGAYGIYRPKNKKHDCVFLCEKKLIETFGFVPKRIYYKIYQVIN